MLVSIVIPCYRSAKTIEFVVDEIDQAFRQHDEYEYEIILVNDGSPDNTYDVIQEICNRNKRVTGINLSRNFGQNSAKMAAIQYVNGDIMITMDDDGQHPAAGIFVMLEKITEGYDLVYAEFPNRKHSKFKRIVSWMNGKTLEILGQSSGTVKVSSFAAYNSFSVNSIKNNRSPITAIGGFVRQVSKRVTNVSVQHRTRKSGKSNYTLTRLIRMWERGLTGFSTRSLDVCLRVGAFVTLGSFLYAFIVLVRKLVHPNIALGYSSQMIVTLFCSGIIMMMIGMLSKYVGQVYLILVHMPNFLIRDEILNCYCEENSADENK